MSTSSTIVLQIPRRYLNKYHTADYGKIDMRTFARQLELYHGDKQLASVSKIGNVNTFNLVKRKIFVDKPFIEIYHHWDGYPGSLGQWLCRYYKSPAKTFELMLAGNCSTIIDDVVNYISVANVNDRCEGARVWKSQQPKLSVLVPKQSQQYQYLFMLNPNQTSGVWLFRGHETEEKWAYVEEYNRTGKLEFF